MAATERRVIQIDVDGAQGEISARKLESALASIDRRLDPLGVATRRYTQDVASLRAAQEAGLRTTDQTAQRITQLGRAMDATRARLSGTTLATGQLQTAMGGAQAAFGLVARAAAVLGVGLGAGALVGYAKNVIEVVGGLGEMAEQMGISTQALQAYQFAAAQGGIKTEQLDVAITKFSKKIGDAAGGNKEAIESFRTLGVKLLDVRGQLRPTEDSLSEVARKILAIEEPAKRTAQEIAFFGRSGAKLETILKDLAGGTDEMKRKAAEAGAMISDNTVKALDDMGDKAKVAELKFSALVAELIAPIGTGPIDGVTAAIEVLALTAQKAKLGFVDLMVNPLLIAKMGIAALQQAQEYGLKLGGHGTAAPNSTDKIAEIDRRIADIRARGTPGFEAEQARLQEERARLAGGLPIGNYGTAFASGGAVRLPTKGARDPGVKGAGEDVQKRIDKAEREARLEVEWAQKIYEASKTSAAAVDDMQARFEAAKKASAAFGDEADKNKEAVARLAGTLYEAGRATDVWKKAAKFNLQTQEIEEGNKLLAAEIRLLEAAPDVRAREIALIKVKIQLQKDGLKEGDVEYQRRVQAVEIQEELNQKLEQGKKAQEAAAEPFKNAIQSLQSYIVEGLTGGFQNARQAILGIWKRLMAELAVATVIRPIIVQPIVSLLGATGLVPQSVVSQYGGGPLGGLLGGGGSTGSIFGNGIGMPGGGGGGLGDLFGLGGFMSRSLWGGANPLFGSPFGGATGDALLSLTGTQLSGVGSIGGVLGGLGGIGMGIMGLAQGNTIGGISGLLGGGLGLAGGLGLLGSWAGPAGMAISLIGGLLGGMLKKKPKAPQAVSNLSFLDGAWSSSTAMSRGKGGSQLASGTNKAAGAVGDIINELTGLYGLELGAGTTGGFLINSVGKKTGNLWQVGLGTYANPQQLPSGFQNGGSTVTAAYTSPEEAISALAAMIVRAGAAAGTLTGLTATQQKVLKSEDITSIEAIKKALDFSKIYDKLARGIENITAAEEAVEALNEQFRSVKVSAKQYGLDVAIIEQRRLEAINKLATDVNADYRRRTLGLTPEGQLQVTLEDLDKEKVEALKNAAYLNQTVTGALVDIVKIEEYYAKQRVAIVEQANAQANNGLEELWRRLTYGDLSGVSPLGTLEGTRSAYQQGLLEAQGGSLTARGNLAGLAEDYVRSSYMYSGSDARTAAVVAAVRTDIAPFFTANDNLTTAATTFNAAVTTYARVVAEQQATIDRLIAQLAARDVQIAELILRLDRMAA